MLEGVLEAWLAAANTFDSDADPAEALGRYIAAKMDLARDRPHGSRIFAREILRGAPEIQDFLETTLRQWVDFAQRRSSSAGSRPVLLRPIEPKTLFYMIWATTQHYADFAHQIATLNGGTPLDRRRSRPPSGKWSTPSSPASFSRREWEKVASGSDDERAVPLPPSREQ